MMGIQDRKRDRRRTALLGMSLGGYVVSYSAAVPDALGLAWETGITSRPEPAQKCYAVKVNLSDVQVPFPSVLGLHEGGLWKTRPSGRPRNRKFQSTPGRTPMCTVK
ncbi:hypothetical protein SPBR_08762 [Sporothrix brasiliensis 5110]|uniref:Uncharacterized protein n=1 Tax=Sporothrix brasiliensis 5110 TaxID=1398154 RepID=A0A0C2IP15_9PEZI|nr:uncharacterized protein SPBR_08762 [Sporothrix brasiliensis 5110]KIH86822.1 hypothetical protein SPBR_08762 [Sporothrix brasiliensis 5110]